MHKKAKAFNLYKDAAMAEMVLECLPKIASELVAPLLNLEKIKLVATGDGEIGVTKITKEIIEMIQCMPELVENITGVNIKSSIMGVANSRNPASRASRIQN
jgi:flotillin